MRSVYYEGQSSKTNTTANRTRINLYTVSNSSNEDADTMHCLTKKSFITVNAVRIDGSILSIQGYFNLSEPALLPCNKVHGKTNEKYELHDDDYMGSKE